MERERDVGSLMEETVGIVVEPSGRPKVET